MHWQLILLLIASLWVLVGVVMVWLGGGSRRKNKKRVGSGQGLWRNVASLGETLEVELTLAPPQINSVMEPLDVMLALDHSGSMGAGPGSPLREAQRACKTFLARLPEKQVRVGLVAFDDRADIVSPLGSSRRENRAALDAIPQGGGTAIEAGLSSCRQALVSSPSESKRVVILLSDGGSAFTPAEKEAKRLRKEVPGVQIICLSFGGYAQHDLMGAVADPSCHHHVTDFVSLEEVLRFLAARVAGGLTTAEVTVEVPNSPRFFRLLDTPGLESVTPQQDLNNTLLRWVLVDPQPEILKLRYNLATRCPGWVKAAGKAHCTWTLHNGEQVEATTRGGLWTLVLPWWLRWAWPLANPLFWLIAARRFCPILPSQPVHECEELVPPPPQLPQPLDPAEPLPIPRQLRTALVVGLGSSGEAVLERLAWLKSETDTPGQLSALTVQVGHPINRPKMPAPWELAERERVVILGDLRGRVEALRRAKSEFAWVPARNWLANPKPLHTLRGVGGDRRLARLALLEWPDELESKIKGKLEPLKQSLTSQGGAQGIVVLTGAWQDPQCSGLLAEVAHICASNDMGVSAVLYSDSSIIRVEGSDAALARELERLMACGGEAVPSSRHEPPVSARQLFDRVVAVTNEGEQAESAQAAAGTIWGLLSTPNLEREVPACRPGETKAHKLEVYLEVTPVEALWRWVREDALCREVNGRWLNLEIVDGDFRLAEPSSHRLDEAVQLFFNGGLVEPPLLLREALEAYKAGGSTGNQIQLILPQVPAEEHYAVQQQFAHGQRLGLRNYLGAWVAQVMQPEQEQGRCGLIVLWTALGQLSVWMEGLVTQVHHAASAELGEAGALMAFLYSDFLTEIKNLRHEVGNWLAKLVRPEALAGLESFENITLPVSLSLELGRKQAEDELVFPDPEAKESILRRSEEWREQRVAQLGKGLAWEVVHSNGSLGLKVWLFDRRLEPEQDLVAALREFLEQYKGDVYRWPAEDWLRTRNLPQPQMCLGTGAHADKVFPGLLKVVDDADSYVTMAWRIQSGGLEETLDTGGAQPRWLPWAWPEEANADRLVAKMRNELKRDVRPLPPTLVQLLIDPHELWCFFGELAQGKVVWQSGQVMLIRGGINYRIGTPADEVGASALLLLQTVTRQVACWRQSLDEEPLPPGQNWSAEPEEAVTLVEANELVRGVLSAPQWPAWREIIRGLALDS